MPDYSVEVTIVVRQPDEISAMDTLHDALADLEINPWYQGYWYMSVTGKDQVGPQEVK